MDNLIGIRFHKLLVIEEDKSVKDTRHKKFLCKCDCGKIKSIRKSSLISGHAKTCGCEEHLRTHGLSSRNKKLYSIWRGMVSRCENKNNKRYNDYGNRGIRVCDEWHNPCVFEEWSNNNGYKYGLTIDRIDNNGNYEPSNCRFVDKKIQNRNTRRNVYFEYGGKKRCLKEISEEVNIPYYRLRYRLRKGEDMENAINKDVVRPTIIIEYCGHKFSLNKWSKLSGIKDITLSKRYKKGLSLNEIFKRRDGSIFSC